MNYFAHPTAVIDDYANIGDDTKIWHFSHIMSNSELGKKCNIGQNVVISPKVIFILWMDQWVTIYFTCRSH